MTKFTIPESVTIIKNNAFQGCSSLSEIIIPSSITSIGDYAFASCSSLSQIMITSSMVSIGNHSFHDCNEISTNFNYTGSIQTYIIPIKGIYNIKSVVASGSGGNTPYTCYSSTEGKGAEITGNFSLDTGDIIDIIVGGQGKKTCTNTTKIGTGCGGGGGGTFIFKRIKSITNSRYQFTKNKIHYETLLVAAGGGGAEDTSYHHFYYFYHFYQFYHFHFHYFHILCILFWF